MTHGAAPGTVDIVVVTGMSGSGKSTAINALEDEGFYCIDNLPTALVPRFVELCAASGDAAMAKVGLGLDLRDRSYVDHWPSVRQEIENAGHNLFMIYLDAADEILLRRFSETRRAHPLGTGRDVPEAIRAERAMLAPVKDRTSLVIDTGNLTVHDLKRQVRALISQQSSTPGPSVTVKSFGYKHGIAADADMVFDVRFLPNPHFVDELRPRTGLDQTVADYVLDRPETREFVERIRAWFEFLVPLYTAEGRSYLTIGIGCTGGRHRSVAIAEAVSNLLADMGLSVIVRHRDIDREA